MNRIILYLFLLFYPNISNSQKFSFSINANYGVLINEFYSFTLLPDGSYVVGDQKTSNAMVIDCIFPSASLSISLSKNISISSNFRLIKNKLGFNPITPALRLKEQFKPVFSRSELNYYNFGLIFQKSVQVNRAKINYGIGPIISFINKDSETNNLDQGEFKQLTKEGIQYVFYYEFKELKKESQACYFANELRVNYVLSRNIYLEANLLYQMGFKKHVTTEGRKEIRPQNQPVIPQIIFLTSQGSMFSCGLGIGYTF